MKQVIGLTGGMGSGKSAVTSALAAILTASRLDADQISREIVEPGAEGWHAIKRAFGARYFNSDRSVNRLLLRREIFSDAGLRDQLNRLLHPLVREVVAARIKELLRGDHRYRLIVEVPLLFEAHWEDFFDTVVVVYANDGACLERLVRRDGLTTAEARQAASSQWPLFDKVMRADHVIDNSGCFAATYLQILHLARVMEDG